jgi:hypothetical protein
MRLRAPDDAPPSVHRLVKRIVETDKEARTTPLKLQVFAVPADLPPASDWPAGMVYVTSLATTAFSDGSHWYPHTKGAAL